VEFNDVDKRASLLWDAKKSFVALLAETVKGRRKKIFDIETRIKRKKSLRTREMVPLFLS
jgi:hypothetical protein